MRVTIKYVGDSHSGEYMASHVIHELSVYGGYTTTVYLKRNMAGGERKRVSPIHSEIERVYAKPKDEKWGWLYEANDDDKLLGASRLED